MRKIQVFSCAAGLGTVLLGTSAWADPVLVPNHSFESEVSCCGGNPGNVTGWTYALENGADGVQNQGANNPVGTDGSNWAFMNVDAVGSVGTMVTSSPVTTIAANTTYTLTVAMGNNAEGGDYGRPGDSTISLLSNGTAIPGASSSIVGDTIPNQSFVDLSTTFTTGGAGDPLVGNPLSIELRTVNGGPSGGRQSLFDNVRLDATPIPEPAAAGLLLVGGLTLLKRRRAVSRA